MPISEKRKMGYTIAICIVLLVGAGAIMMAHWSSSPDSARELLVLYDIQVDAESTTEYNMFAPIVVNEDGSVSDVMKNISIKSGNPAWKIEESAYGKGVNISGKGSIWIRFSGVFVIDRDIYANFSRYPYGLPDFSMWVDNSSGTSDGNTCWFFLNETGGNITEIELDLQIEQIQHMAQFHPEAGWQTVPIRFEATIP